MRQRRLEWGSVQMRSLGEGFAEAAKAEGEELLRLKVGGDPGVRGVEVSAALKAVDDGGAAGEALGDVDMGAEAAHAHVGRVGGHFHGDVLRP